MSDIKQAIERYKKCVEFITKDLNHSDDELYRMDRPSREEIEMAKSDHLLAIEALEKQIPKKVHGRFNEYFCPSCNEYICDHECGIEEEYQYCNQCGQAISWEVEE